MSKWHLFFILIIGYVVGYYFRGLGNMTVGKLYPAKG